MAKKVVATLKTDKGVKYARVIKMVKSQKTDGYNFVEEIIPSDKVNDFFKK